MLSVIVENKYKQKLNITNNSDYALLSVSGLTPPPATVNYAVLAGKDGAVFNSARVEIRNMVLLIAPLNSIEKSRIELYKYFKVKQYIKLYLENNTRSVWIDGYIETIEGDLYTQNEEIQVSIICCDPYFKDTKTDEYIFSNVINRFSFPFSIEETPGIPISELQSNTEIAITNKSDTETGCIITLLAHGAVSNPTIYNMTTNENFSLSVNMVTGDEIIIDTRSGHKSVYMTHEGTTTNILNNMLENSEWLNLIVGDNIFSYECSSGSNNLNVMVSIETIYEGM